MHETRNAYKLWWEHPCNLDQEGEGKSTVNHKKSVVKTGIEWKWIRIVSGSLGVSTVEPF